MKEQPTGAPIKGLIISALLMLFAVFISVFQYEQVTGLSVVPIAIMLGGIIWSCMSFSKAKQGNVTFGNIFVHGFKVSALVAGIMAGFMLLLFKVIMPDSLERSMEAARTKMQSDGKMTQDQIEQGMAMGRKIAVVTIPVFTAVLYLFVGAIASLIGAAVSKRTPNPTPFDRVDAN